MKIPKIIHQTWKTEKIPSNFLPFVNSWKTKNPDWHYMFWTDRDCKRFIKTNYPDFFKLYNAYDEQIKRIDAFRYFLLHHFGGLYVDVDFECLKPLEPLLKIENTCILGLEPEIHATRLYKRKQLVCNAIMASPPRHRFWEHIFTVLEKSQRKKDVLEATGPMMLENALKTYPHKDIKLLASNAFYPLVDINKDKLFLSKEEHHYYSEMMKRRSFPEESYAVHYWAGTWYSKGIWLFQVRIYTKLRAFFIRLFT
jgi:mannosyltransferase OCH1-like enzyme